MPEQRSGARKGEEKVFARALVSDVAKYIQNSRAPSQTNGPENRTLYKCCRLEANFSEGLAGSYKSLAWFSNFFGNDELFEDLHLNAFRRCGCVLFKCACTGKYSQFETYAYVHYSLDKTVSLSTCSKYAL